MDKHSANWFSGKWNEVKYPLCSPKTWEINGTEELYYSQSECDMEMKKLSGTH